MSERMMFALPIPQVRAVRAWWWLVVAALLAVAWAAVLLWIGGRMT